MKKIKYISMILAALFCVSCSNPLLDLEKGAESANKSVKTSLKGTLKFSINDASRSILPDLQPTELTDFTLTAIDSKNNQNLLGSWNDYAALVTASVEIEVGEYTFILTAKEKSAEIYGSSKVTVVEGNNLISFRIGYSSLGDAQKTGKISVKFPEDLSSQTLMLTVYLYKVQENGEKTLCAGDIYSSGYSMNGRMEVNPYIYMIDAEGNVINYPDTNNRAGSMPAFNALNFTGEFVPGDYILEALVYKMVEGSEYVRGFYRTTVQIAEGAVSSSVVNMDSTLNNIQMITLDTNGGVIFQDEKTDQFEMYMGTTYTVAEGISLPTESDMEKPGYVFKGWYKDEALTIEAKDSYEPGTVSGEQSFYAKWEEGERDTSKDLFEIADTGTGVLEINITPTKNADVALIIMADKYGYPTLVEKSVELTAGVNSKIQLPFEAERGNVYFANVILGNTGSAESGCAPLYGWVLDGKVHYLTETEREAHAFVCSSMRFDLTVPEFEETSEGFKFKFPFRKANRVSVTFYYSGEESQVASYDYKIPEGTEEVFEVTVPSSFLIGDNYTIAYEVYTETKLSENSTSITTEYRATTYNDSERDRLLTGVAKYNPTGLAAVPSENGFRICVPKECLEKDSSVYISFSDNHSTKYSAYMWHSFTADELAANKDLYFDFPFVEAGLKYSFYASIGDVKRRYSIKATTTPTGNFIKDINLSVDIDLTENEEKAVLSIAPYPDVEGFNICDVNLHYVNQSNNYCRANEPFTFDSEAKTYTVLKSNLYESDEVEQLDWQNFIDNSDTHYFNLEYKYKDYNITLYPNQELNTY